MIRAGKARRGRVRKEWRKKARWHHRLEIWYKCGRANRSSVKLCTLSGTSNSAEEWDAILAKQCRIQKNFPMSVLMFPPRSVSPKVSSLSSRVLTLAYTKTIVTSSRRFSTTKMAEEKFKPAKRVAGQRQDVWSIINEAAAASPKQPIVNMGQGFL